MTTGNRIAHALKKCTGAAGAYKSIILRYVDFGAVSQMRPGRSQNPAHTLVSGSQWSQGHLAGNKRKLVASTDLNQKNYQNGRK